MNISSNLIYISLGGGENTSKPVPSSGKSQDMNEQLSCNLIFLKKNLEKCVQSINQFISEDILFNITRRQNFQVVHIETNCRRHVKVHLKWKVSTI